MYPPAAREEVEDRSATLGVDPHHYGEGILCIEAALVGEVDVAVCDTLEIVRSKRKAVRTWCWFDIDKSNSSVAVDAYISSSCHAIKREYSSGSC